MTKYVIVALVILSHGLIAQENWTSDFSGIASLSSPRVSDLNQDGTKDIILGAGRIEFMPCDSAVIAVDGVTGELLWSVKASDQMFGSASFIDINQDSIDDVIIPGRSAELIAICGSSGEVIWRFLEANSSDVIQARDWYNFYNLQFVPDIDEDGYTDFVICNGGNARVEANDPDRPVGYIMTVSSLTGTLLSLDEMPDGRESYFSVNHYKNPITKQHEIIFGSGGETMPGALYLEHLDNIIDGNLSKIKQLHHSDKKGYIGPIARVDVTMDGIADIIVNTVQETVIALDGYDYQKLWEVEMKGSESYSQPCIGYFNKDSVPDVFVTYRRGNWPELNWSFQKMIDGKTGEVLFVDSLGIFQNSSPLAIDLNEDGVDEIVMSLNMQKEIIPGMPAYYNTLIAIELSTHQIIQIANDNEGTNLSSTPWLGDLDDDGFLDFVYSHGINHLETFTFDGMKLHRIVTKIPVPKNLQWGAYQGSHYDGNFRQND